ncbi:Phosphatidylinositol N-acetylglucosaminyltransferase subunit C [Portunus trituberculatus]|uniref:Phosphatidylinositol N-acetylglucosaminyltransferase subunit C n=1 Tax=Portunus trituberculatus TaxID=210409 RepID=A0A5B7CIY2_PORTR|nr:Phosphatidylinositol N-acetylglucosaminyltransferase subunit C [Portunus trituberculatus]
MGVGGYIITRTKLITSVRDDLKVACFYMVLIACASPIIKSLTGSVATDSINASTTFLLLLRLAVHDYGTEVAIVNPTVSHNVGLFASVCLASRLESDLDVFTLMTVAVTLFTLFPSFRRYFQNQLGYRWSIVVTMVVAVVTVLGILVYAPHLLLLFLIALFVCNLLVPMLYVSLQGYKQSKIKEKSFSVNSELHMRLDEWKNEMK